MPQQSPIRSPREDRTVLNREGPSYVLLFGSTQENFIPLMYVRATHEGEPSTDEERLLDAVVTQMSAFLQNPRNLGILGAEEGGCRVKVEKKEEWTGENPFESSVGLFVDESSEEVIYRFRTPWSDRIVEVQMPSALYLQLANVNDWQDRGILESAMTFEYLFNIALYAGQQEGETGIESFFSKIGGFLDPYLQELFRASDFRLLSLFNRLYDKGLAVSLPGKDVNVNWFTLYLLFKERLEGFSWWDLSLEERAFIITDAKMLVAPEDGKEDGAISDGGFSKARKFLGEYDPERTIRQSLFDAISSFPSEDGPFLGKLEQLENQEGTRAFVFALYSVLAHRYIERLQSGQWKFFIPLAREKLSDTIFAFRVERFSNGAYADLGGDPDLIFDRMLQEIFSMNLILQGSKFLQALEHRIYDLYNVFSVGTVEQEHHAVHFVTSIINRTSEKIEELKAMNDLAESSKALQGYMGLLEYALKTAGGVIEILESNGNPIGEKIGQLKSLLESKSTDSE